ncbi:hypothetical protein BEH_25210 (plasmid) [Priestia filamentosa]|uniref:HTH crp-type domain-containing protein n=1 Tax=Priestia filamentosa TaxID=1402861 RepID=A0A2S1LZP9_9BACI|nr:hypothetical protein BEH_25210 [Priestia filamentosa]
MFVLDIKARNSVPANILEIAKLIGTARQNTSTVINSLVKKGLIFRGNSDIESNNVKGFGAEIAFI